MDAESGGGGDAASNMNMRGVWLHVMADALGSVVVIISALVMWLTEWEYKKLVDPGKKNAAFTDYYVFMIKREREGEHF